MTNKEFAEYLIARIEEHKNKVCGGKSDATTAAYAQAHIHICELISILTPAEEEEPTANIAHWKRIKIDKTHYNYYCDHCNYKSEFRKSVFCPGCGYKMVEVQQTLDNADDL